MSRGDRNGTSLLVVVLGSAASDSRYTDTKNLFRWAWQQLSHAVPISAGFPQFARKPVALENLGCAIARSLLYRDDFYR